VLSAGISTKLVERFAPRRVAAPGLAIAAGGTLWLSTLSVGSSYLWHVLPALFVTYFGLRMGFMPPTLTAVRGVEASDAGAASAILHTAQQIGAALGVSVLAMIASSTTSRMLPDAGRVLGACWARAGRVLGAMMLLAIAMVLATVKTRQTQRAQSPPCT
jgi:hypothetical protein